MLRRKIDLKKGLVLTEKKRKQIEFQRQLRFAKYEIHIEEGQPVKMVNIKENIKL